MSDGFTQRLKHHCAILLAKKIQGRGTYQHQHQHQQLAFALRVDRRLLSVSDQVAELTTLRV